jgi:hypothetical protein
MLLLNASKLESLFFLMERMMMPINGVGQLIDSVEIFEAARTHTFY